MKWAIFRPQGSKVSVQKVLLCPFHCKARPSGVSLESPGLENIPQVSGSRAEVDQNHDARNAVWATVSVLKWSVAVFRPTSSKMRVQKVFLCPFHCKPRPSGVSLEYAEIENIPQFREIEYRPFKITCAQDGPGYCFSLKVKLGYSSAKKLESARSKSFALSLSLETKAVTS